MSSKSVRFGKKNINFNLDKFIGFYSDFAKKILTKMKPIQKLTDDTFDINNLITTQKSYYIFDKYNFNVNQLKKIAKELEIKVSGNKPQLKNRIFCYLYFNNIVIKIQKMIRGKLVRIYEKLHGPAFYNRTLCNNNDDFVTCQNISDIKYNQFISFVDSDNFIYGFDVSSLYHLYIRSETNNMKNPYNRNLISNNVIHDLKRMIKISKLLKIPIITSINDVEVENISIESRCLTLFQNIGNYSDSNWFLSLNQRQLKKFLRELYDIWNYRAQISYITKCNICPPNGNPFQFQGYNIYETENYELLQNNILIILENIVNRSIDNDSKVLGGYYILGALTLVSPIAAETLPWLYDSMIYN